MHENIVRRLIPINRIETIRFYQGSSSLLNSFIIGIVFV